MIAQLFTCKYSIQIITYSIIMHGHHVTYFCIKDFLNVWVSEHCFRCGTSRLSSIINKIYLFSVLREIMVYWKRKYT